MDDQEILQLIREALDEVIPDQADRFQDIHLDTAIRDLGIDSLAAMEMVGAIEDRLARSLNEDELAKIKTLGGLAALIRRG